ACLLRKGRARFHALGARRWDARLEVGSARSDRENEEREHLPGCARLASATFVRYAAHSRHVLGETSRGKHGRREGEVERGRNESARRLRCSARRLNRLSYQAIHSTCVVAGDGLSTSRVLITRLQERRRTG